MSKTSLSVDPRYAKPNALTVLGPEGRYIELDRKVDEAEGSGIMARWEFGLLVLAERGDRKQLPNGRLDEIAAAIGKSRQEVGQRAAFAYLYPTPELVSNAVRNFGSWHGIVAEGLTVTPRLSAPTTPAILPAGMFNVILADPPWQYDFAETDNRAIENQYPTMDVVEIAGYRDSAGVSIQSVIADDAVLFLWATSPKLREALLVMDGWGFDYVTQAVWVKDRIGMGYWVRQQHETILIGRRGTVSPPEQEIRRSSVIDARRGDHSAKPDAAYAFIETMFPDASRLEVFAREARDGWSVFGNQVGRVSNYDWEERRRAAEDELLNRLGGVDRLWRILSRRLAPLVNLRRADLHDDLLGVDYWAIRPTGSRPLGVDIKCREQDYNDLLLEFVSNTATGSPGWTVNRTNITDFVLYLWPESEVLISYPLLRSATIENLEDWRTRFPESANHTTTGGDYRTRWIAVPDAVVYQGIGYRVTGPAQTVTAAEPVNGPRCPKCNLPPLASTPEAFDPSYLEHRCENRHSWHEKAA